MSNCNSYKKGECVYNKDGVCKKNLSKKDGLIMRCSGTWTEDKIKYFKYYAEMFSTGMKNLWGQRCYIDLFSGPGRCIIREGLREINGSSVEAVNLKDKFTKYFFVDKNSDCINTLKKRVGNDGTVKYYNEDCNIVIKDIISNIPSRSLSLAIIDPDSLHFRFDSYKKLSERKIDLIVNYPIGPIERAVSSVQKNKTISKTLDSFHPGWSEIMNRKDWGCSKEANINELKMDYVKKIEDLGYFSSELTIPFKNTKNATMFYLIAFSKDKKGVEFWRKSTGALEKKLKKTMPLF